MLDGRASAGASVDSARQNLAATFVNAFVNAGFGQVRDVQSMCRRSGMLLRASYYLLLSLQDKLMTVTPDSSSGASSGNWLFKNKEHGKMSAAASLVSLHHFRLSILFSIWFCLIIYHHDHRV